MHQLTPAREFLEANVTELLQVGPVVSCSYCYHCPTVVVKDLTRARAKPLLLTLSFQVEALDQQRDIQRAKEERWREEPAPRTPSHSMMSRYHPPQQPATLVSSESTFRTPPTPQSTAPCHVEVFSPPTAGKFAGQAAEEYPSLNVSSPLTPVSVSPNIVSQGAPSLLASNKPDFGSAFEVSSAWRGTGLQETSLAAHNNAVKNDSFMGSRC